MLWLKFFNVKSGAVFSWYPFISSKCITITPFPSSFTIRFQMKMKKQQKQNIWLPYLKFYIHVGVLLWVWECQTLYPSKYFVHSSLAVCHWLHKWCEDLCSVWSQASTSCFKSRVAARDYSGEEDSHRKCLTGKICLSLRSQ